MDDVLEPGPTARPIDGRPKILVLDDSALILSLVCAALEEAGFAALAAVDLDAVEAHLLRGQPDLVLLDVQMPGAAGDDVGKVLRGVCQLEAPILLLSGLPESELARRARDAGLDGYICKDAGLEHLVARVRDFLAGRSPGAIR